MGDMGLKIASVDLAQYCFATYGPEADVGRLLLGVLAGNRCEPEQCARQCQLG
jgi:hypothetical protein